MEETETHFRSETAGLLDLGFKDKYYYLISFKLFEHAFFFSKNSGTYYLVNGPEAWLKRVKYQRATD